MTISLGLEFPICQKRTYILQVGFKLIPSPTIECHPKIAWTTKEAALQSPGAPAVVSNLSFPPPGKVDFFASRKVIVVVFKCLQSPFFMLSWILVENVARIQCPLFNEIACSCFSLLVQVAGLLL